MSNSLTVLGTRFGRSRHYQAGYAACALGITSFELIPRLLINTTAIPTLAATIVFSSVLLSGIWFGIVSDCLYICFYVLISLTQYHSELTFPVLGIFFIAAVWILENHFLRALVLLVAAGTVNTFQSPDWKARSISEAILILCVLAIAGLLKALANRARTAENLSKQIEKQSQDALRRMRTTLSEQLHDTAVRDFTQIALLIDKIAIEHPDIRDELTPISSTARRGISQIRPLIRELNVAGESPSLGRAIHESTVLLQTRDISLDASVPANIDGILERHSLALANLFVRESATNILKYAQPSTRAQLTITFDPSQIVLTMTNIVASMRPNPHMSGGFASII